MPGAACTKTTNGGTPCRLPAEPNRDTCKWHGPPAEVAAIAGKMRREGHENRQRAKIASAEIDPLRSVDKIQEFLEVRTAEALAVGDSQMVNAIARASKAALDLLPVADLQKENADLRALLKEHGALKTK